MENYSFLATKMLRCGEKSPDVINDGGRRQNVSTCTGNEI